MVEIAVNQNKQGYMEVYTEDYVEGEYDEHISIVKQDISFIDLPTNPDEEITIPTKSFINRHYISIFTFVLSEIKEV